MSDINANRQRLVGEAFSNLTDTADGRDATACHDRNAVGEFLQLFEFMAGDEQTLPVVRQREKEVDELLASNRVDATEGFI